MARHLAAGLAELAQRGPARTARDGIAEHLARRKYGAGRVLAALELVRADAAEGGSLTFARLEAWQREVLGVATAPFRTTRAWARAGSERYAYRDELPEAFEACLAEVTDPAVPLPSRAARVYLDVLHFYRSSTATRDRRRSRCTSCLLAKAWCWTGPRRC